MGEHPNVTVAAIRGGAPWRLSRNPVRMQPLSRHPHRAGPDRRRCEARACARCSALSPTGRASQSRSCTFTSSDRAGAARRGQLPIIEAARRGAEGLTGASGRRTLSGGPAPMRCHLTAYGVPCVAFGPGGRMHLDAKNAQLRCTPSASMRWWTTAWPRRRSIPRWRWTCAAASVG